MTAKQENGPDLVQGKKRRHNVGKACENCRRRRVKCDGIHPECGTCKVYKDDCSWDAKSDLRKPISRQQVEALQTRIADLEKMLKDHGLDPGHPSGHGTDGADLGDPPRLATHGSGTGVEDETTLSDRDDSGDWPQTHLVENETGDFQVYGPTSAFRHLSISTPHHPRLSPHDGESPSDVFGGTALMPGFRKYLPQEVDVTEEEHEIVLDRFFRYYAAWGQRTHPVLFLEDMHLALYSSSPVPKTPHYSPMLHNAILAIALCFSDNPYLRLSDTRNRFAQEAKKCVEQEGTSPTVATVQALLHLASYHSTSAEHNLGWLYMGMALRCALALGLNIDNSPMVKSGKLTEIQARERNVTYWTTFIQEGVWAPYIGRPVNWPEYTTPLPTIDQQLDNMLWTPDFIPDRIVHQTIKPQPTFVSSAFVETVKLMEIGARIMKTLYGLKADLGTLASTGVISEISLSLTTWFEQLPPQLVITSHSTKNLLPHILMMHLSWAWLSVLLHRPFYRPTAKLPGHPGKQPEHEGYNAQMAIKHCDRAAVHIVNLLQTWHRLHDLRFCPPTALQCCFVAGTTHLLAFVSNKTPKRKSDALNRAKDCIRLMSYMAMSWPAGQQKQELLENLLAEYGAKMEGTEQSVPLDQPVPDVPLPTQFDFLGAFAQQGPEGSMTNQARFQSTAMMPIPAPRVNAPLASSMPNTTFAGGMTSHNSMAETITNPFLPSSYEEHRQYLPPAQEPHYTHPSSHDYIPPNRYAERRAPSFSDVPSSSAPAHQSLEQLYYPDIDPWQHGINHGYFDTSSGMAQHGASQFDPSLGSSQAQADLNGVDPETQAILQFFMQSDHEFSMR